MTRCDNEPESPIEVHGFSFEPRRVVLARMQGLLLSWGCCVAGYRPRRRAVEYSFEMELDGAMELYCGLAEAGLELTQVSHRVLTDLCVLRSHQRAVRAERRPASLPAGRVVKIRVLVDFVELPEQIEAGEVPARCGERR